MTMKTCTIADNYDPGAIITASADPAEEFALWQEHARQNPDDWTGDEFTLRDFEDYIGAQMPAPQCPKAHGGPHGLTRLRSGWYECAGCLSFLSAAEL